MGNSYEKEVKSESKKLGKNKSILSKLKKIIGGK